MSHKSIEKLAVVIPNFNGADFIEEAIDSLLQQDMSADIIIVENGSRDNSLDILKSYNDKITILQNEKNLGFAGGVNVGISYTIKHGYDAVALFNNDAVADSEWLSELVNSIQDDIKIGIATCCIKLKDGSILDSTGEFYTTWGLPYPRGRGKSVDSYHEKEFVFGASGGASLYKTALFRDIGLFDEKFFAYYEDTDISFRAQLAGWKVVYNPKSFVTHHQGETSKKMVPGFTVYQTFKNLPMLFWKNTPRNLLLPIGIRFFIAYNLILLKALVSGKAWPAVKGVWYSFIYIPHTVHQRWIIQRGKSVSTNYINSVIVHDLPPNQTGLRKFRKIFTGK
ncbi:MAG: glycosyltransferase family 2 protein [Candidatus Nomurabacteria bacterium]|nr:MAG: glycosyltransferase family 2 protein [Candidatus Nomurabacteria bacterium]